VLEATGVWLVDEKLGWVRLVHRRTDAALGYGLRSREAAVVRGMVLGDCSLIPQDLELAFQRSGITHILPHFAYALVLRFHARLTDKAPVMELALG
jgi:competence protein ComEC